MSIPENQIPITPEWVRNNFIESNTPNILSANNTPSRIDLPNTSNSQSSASVIHKHVSPTSHTSFITSSFSSPPSTPKQPTPALSPLSSPLSSPPESPVTTPTSHTATGYRYELALGPYVPPPHSATPIRSILRASKLQAGLPKKNRRVCIASPSRNLHAPLALAPVPPSYPEIASVSVRRLRQKKVLTEGTRKSSRIRDAEEKKRKRDEQEEAAVDRESAAQEQLEGEEPFIEYNYELVGAGKGLSTTGRKFKKVRRSTGNAEVASILLRLSESWVAPAEFVLSAVAGDKDKAGGKEKVVVGEPKLRRNLRGRRAV